MKTIYILSQGDTASFAANELARYLRKVTSQRLRVQSAISYDLHEEGFWLGLSGDFALKQWPSFTASVLDDAFALKQTDTQILIAGANNRSILFGVYAYLESLGVRWIRPGARGEFIPHLDQLPKDKFILNETASYRHRGICIEGAPSLEHALNMVDWMCKRRMNSFFLQFRNSGTFWDRWYSRDYNPLFGARQTLDNQDHIRFDAAVIAEVKKRGMVLHQVGHGWTAATVDLPANGWRQTDIEVSVTKRRWLAKVNGKREVHQQIPVNTELCYSYGPAFRAFVENVSSYASQHPEIDVVHVWLSDAMNNKCECKECSSLTPADWYVKLVNALAEQLYSRNPRQRFVFLSYFESWWAPEDLTVESEYGNAILMFAPISRCFRHTLLDASCSEPFTTERPALNRAEMPRSNQALVSLFGGWRKAFTGDSFLFDYYMWSGINSQCSDLSLARVIHADMKSLKQMRLNGVMSCQVLRSFWPTGLSMAAMADTAWNRNRSWRDIKERHFIAAYGADAGWVEQYLSQLEKILLGKASHSASTDLQRMIPDKLRQLEAYLQQHSAKLHSCRQHAGCPAHRESFQILIHHNQFLLKSCQSHLGKLKPDDVANWLLRSERSIHPYLDVPTLMSMQIKQR